MKPRTRMQIADGESSRARVLAALPGSAAQVMAASGLSSATVNKWLVRLTEDGDIHVLDKMPGKRRDIRIYARGRPPGWLERDTGRAPSFMTDPIMGCLFQHVGMLLQTK